MSINTIDFESVEKRYGHQPVLNGITLNVQAGESFGLVGVNGAGKSTLIKCLLDFTEINAGKIIIFGLANTMPEARRRLSYLPEKFNPPYYLTGRDFLQYMARLYNVTYSETELEEVLSNVDFDAEALSKPVRQLSKGMSQKLGLAACLLSDRDLLVLDEPMSGLDPRARAYLKEYFKQWKQQGRSLFFSTHLLADVESLCDRVAILHEGELRFTGSPAECCDKYGQTEFEQAYLQCVGAKGVSQRGQVLTL